MYFYWDCNRSYVLGAWIEVDFYLWLLLESLYGTFSLFFFVEFRDYYMYEHIILKWIIWDFKMNSISFHEFFDIRDSEIIIELANFVMTFL